MTELSPIFALADRHIDEEAALDPCGATSLGIAGYDHLLTDWSPDGYAARAAHTRQALARVNELPVTNEHDRLARDFISERFDAELMAHDSGEWQRSVRALAAPASGLRGTFDIMPRADETAWVNIAARMAAVPAALTGLRATYESGRSDGHMSARRQALAAADQASTWAEGRWFNSLTDEAAGIGGLPSTLLAELQTGADAANAASSSAIRASNRRMSASVQRVGRETCFVSRRYSRAATIEASTPLAASTTAAGSSPRRRAMLPSGILLTS